MTMSSNAKPRPARTVLDGQLRYQRRVWAGVARGLARRDGHGAAATAACVPTAHRNIFEIMQADASSSSAPHRHKVFLVE